MHLVSLFLPPFLAWGIHKVPLLGESLCFAALTDITYCVIIVGTWCGHRVQLKGSVLQSSEYVSVF